MFDSYLKLFSPIETEKSKYFEIIHNFKFKPLGSPVYILDWTFLFEQIDNWKKINKRFANHDRCWMWQWYVFHVFLEKYYKQGIIGIERQDSTEDYIKFEKMGTFLLQMQLIFVLIL